MSLPIRINEGSIISIDRNEEQKKGLVVKLQSDLYLIFQKREKEYGFYLINPWTKEGGKTKWGLTEPQCSRMINRLIKNPSYGYGKSQEEVSKKLIKIINKIKKSYVKNKLQSNSISIKTSSKRQPKNGTNLKKINKSFKHGNRKSRFSKGTRSI